MTLRKHYQGRQRIKMALFSDKFIERSCIKWPQRKIDALGIVISQAGTVLMRANGTMKSKDSKELMRLRIKRG